MHIIFLSIHCHSYTIIHQLLQQLTGRLLLRHKVVHRSTLWHRSRCIIVRNTSWLSCIPQHTCSKQQTAFIASILFTQPRLIESTTNQDLHRSLSCKCNTNIMITLTQQRCQPWTLFTAPDYLSCYRPSPIIVGPSFRSFTVG